jgi:hypothetical protein
MARLFDSGAEEQKAKRAQEERDGVRRRAEEVERVLREELELDQARSALEQKLAAQPMGVQPIKYQSYRQAGSRWVIEHSQVGDDYVYQMFPLRPIKADWRDTVALLIAAMDGVFPRSIQITYVPPDDRYQVRCFTIRVTKVVGMPGWAEACEGRALRALVGVQAWD